MAVEKLIMGKIIGDKMTLYKMAVDKIFDNWQNY